MGVYICIWKRGFRYRKYVFFFAQKGKKRPAYIPSPVAAGCKRVDDKTISVTKKYKGSNTSKGQRTEAGVNNHLIYIVGFKSHYSQTVSASFSK